MTQETDPHQFLIDADLLFNEIEVRNAIAAIANALNSAFLDESLVILSVMNGGLYITGQLLPYLHFPVQINYVHATRYQGKTTGNNIQWIAEPPKNIKGKKVLIVDDILDEGITLKAISDKCLEVGAEAVLTAVLLEKMLGHQKPITADYVGLKVQDRYVFGCGMDVQGWWRNLPQIYALKAT